MMDERNILQSDGYSLKPLFRLAAAYAVRKSRRATVAVFALDQRLAGIVRGASEPVLAQLRLAWWRDALSAPPAERPEVEPLLDLLRALGPDTGQLVPMVDGWEELVGTDRLDGEAIARFAAGRARGWDWLAQANGLALPATEIVRAGSEWALIDLREGLSANDERAAAQQVIAAQSWQRIRWPRAVAPLAVLHGLARRVRHRADARMLDGPLAMATAMRLGIFGR